MHPSLQNIIELCLQKFRSLPKTGKPTAGKEWTVLAAVVMHGKDSGSKVVGLGVGTKCLGQSELCGNGLILNDSHAEVLARRALLRYVYHELRKAADGGSVKSTIFEWNAERRLYEVRPDISWHFMCTHTPCGDACIVEEPIKEDDIPRKRPKTSNNGENSHSEQVFTGAKLIGQTNCDLMHQKLGAVRTKPGRGNRTLSMSCSDKMSKWALLGLQGALLDTLLDHPIYFQTMNFCCSSANKEAVERAIYGRWLDSSFEHTKFIAKQPEIRICADIHFEYEQQNDKTPSPNGLVWCDIDEKLKPYEISVNGKRQGVTAKKQNYPQAALKISKYFLMNEFVELLKSKPELMQKHNLTAEKLAQLQYCQLKNISKDYQKAWSQAKREYFKMWTEKPRELLQFTLIDDSNKPMKPMNYEARLLA